MNRVIIFEVFLFALLAIGMLLGSLELDRAGQVFLTVGMIDLIMGLAAWRNWPILRGDVSNNAPLSKRDAGETARDEYAVDQDRPSSGFIAKIVATGAVALSIGAVLLLFFA